ncbi:hypothetical protein FQN50_003756 [Emmonsiellopsis sp. PD_5]|nr:hypothetical protein FQN50_003756 [Emmonsiellopsis sp. PD_5]
MPLPSLLKQFSNYTNSSVGLENFLRLIQTICQVIAATAGSPAEAEPWGMAWGHLALSRRYFRYLQFIDCFGSAWDAIVSTQSAGGYVLRTLQAGEWSCLGGYLLLEAFTILDALNIHPTPWAKQTLLESYKFWFFSMLFSMAGVMYQLAFLPTTKTTKTSSSPSSENPDGDVKKKVSEKETEKEKEKETEKEAEPVETGPLMREFVATACDILIPGAALGWMDVSFLTISVAAVLSTVLRAMDKWGKVQAQAAARG